MGLSVWFLCFFEIFEKIRKNKVLTFFNFFRKIEENSEKFRKIEKNGENCENLLNFFRNLLNFFGKNWEKLRKIAKN